MDLDPLQNWLKEQARSEVWASFLYGIGCTIFAGVVLCLTSIPVVFLASTLGHPLTTAPIAICFLTILFLINARTRRPYEAANIAHEQHLHPAARSSTSPVTLLAYPGFDSANPLHYLLLGPRLSHIGYAHFRQALDLHQLNLHEGARTLHTLLSARKRIPIEQLIEHTNLKNPAPLLLTLRQIPGIILLTQPPTAMTLTSELRQELSTLVDPLPELPHLPSTNDRATAALDAIHHAVGIAPQGKTPNTTPEPTPGRKIRLAPRHTATTATRSNQKQPPPDPASVWQQHRPRKH